MQSVLVSMLVNMGDVVVMTSALDLLRSRCPGLRIGVLARPESAEILAGNPVVDELLIYPYRSGSPFNGLPGLIRRIRAGGFESFLSLDRRPRGAAAAFLAGLRERVGPDVLFAGSRPRLMNRLLFTRTVHLTEEECRGGVVEMFNLAAGRAFGFTGRGRITLPPETSEQGRRALSFLAAAGGRPVIGLGVKTNDPRKTWPAEGFARLMTRLKTELNAFLYLIGTPADGIYIRELLESFDSRGVLNLVGRTRLLDLPALARRSSLVIASDNGAAHLMANSGLDRLLVLLVGTGEAIVADAMPRAEFFDFSPAGLPGFSSEDLDRQVDRVFQAAAAGLEKSKAADPPFGN